MKRLVVLCSALTYSAYRIVLKARPHVPMSLEGDSFDDDDASREDHRR